jgi:DNA-binding MarR family transcriptional regulator
MIDSGTPLRDRIDSLIHAPARLQIVMQLYVVDRADATFLLNRTGLTWGNLSTHISKLEEGGYVAVEKNFRGRKPHTMIELTDRGREAFETYRSLMREALFDGPQNGPVGCREKLP